MQAKTGETSDPVLSERQREIVCMLANGIPYKAVQAHLRITRTTLRNHISAILGKLGAENATHAVALALAQGIIQTDQITNRPRESIAAHYLYTCDAEPEPAPCPSSASPLPSASFDRMRAPDARPARFASPLEVHFTYPAMTGAKL